MYWRRKFFQNKSLHVTCKRISLWTIPWQCKYSRPSNNWQKYLNRTGKEITSYFNLEVAVTFLSKKRIFRVSGIIGFIVNSHWKQCLWNHYVAVNLMTIRQCCMWRPFLVHKKISWKHCIMFQYISHPIRRCEWGRKILVPGRS